MLDANIAQTLHARALTQAFQEAVIFPEKRDARGAISYRHLTYQQLDRLSTQLAKGLQHHGIGPGVRTAFMVKPSLEFFVLTFALFRAKAIPILIDPGIGVQHIRTCLAEAEAEAFVGIPAAHLARIACGWKGKGWRKLVCVSRWKVWGMLSYDELLRAGEQQNETSLAPATGDELAAVLFTSGSTGVPKGVPYTHAQFRAQITALQSVLNIAVGERDLCTFPLFALFAPALGMTAVIPEMDFTRPGSVDPERIHEAIMNFGITNLFGSPALLKRVARDGRERAWHWPSLSRVLSAGAPVQAATIGEFRQLLREDCRFYTPYGATECLPVAIAESTMLLGETSHLTNTGAGICVGYPAPDTTIRIIRIADTALPQLSPADSLAPGEIGEIIVAAPQCTLSYDHRPEATELAKSFDPYCGKFFHRMGDLGYFDSAGRLWFCGRKSQRVRTPEGELYTIPCEAIFNQHPWVSRSALVGLGSVPNVIPAICIETERVLKSREKAQLIQELRDRAQAYPHTRGIQHFFLHPAFPVDVRHNAKIFREKLQAWAEVQWQRQSSSRVAAVSLEKLSSVNS